LVLSDASQAGAKRLTCIKGVFDPDWYYTKGGGIGFLLNASTGNALLKHSFEGL